MVKWRVFTERWDDGYLGFEVRDVQECESLLNVLDNELARRPLPIRMTINFVGNDRLAEDQHGND